MKIAKSLILMLVLAGVTYAGDMSTFGATYGGDIPTFEATAISPPTSSEKSSNGTVTPILVAIVQNLLSLR